MKNTNDPRIVIVKQQIEFCQDKLKEEKSTDMIDSYNRQIVMRKQLLKVFENE